MGNKKHKIPGSRNVDEIKKSSRKESGDIVYDFSFPTCWVSIKNKDYTNFLKNNECLPSVLYIIFHKIISSYDTLQKLKDTRNRHVHKLDEIKSTKVMELLVIAYTKAKGVDKTKAKDTIDQLYFDSELYQIGNVGSLRLIGILEEEHYFRVLLIDHHHLIYPSDKHNESDFMKYDYCIFTDGGKK